MSNREDIDIIMDIKECIDRIISYTKNLRYADFLNDFKTQDAVIRNIEIIGEAVKSLSNKIKEKYPDIPWKNIAGTRDKLIHGYFGVNIDIIWNIAHEEAPNLIQKINEIIANYTS